MLFEESNCHLTENMYIYELLDFANFIAVDSHWSNNHVI